MGQYLGTMDSSRNWNGPVPWMDPAQPVYCEKDTHTSNQARYGNNTSGRVASMTCEGISPLSMTSLHSSLPNSAPPETRVLPMPTRNYSIPSTGNITSTMKPPGDRGTDRVRLPSHPSISNLSAVNDGMPYRGSNGGSWTSVSSTSESRRSSANYQSTSSLMPPPGSRAALSSGVTIPIAGVPNTTIGPTGYVTLGMAEGEAATASNVPSLNYSSSSPSSSFTSLSSMNPRQSASGYSSGLPAMSTSHDSLLSRSSSPPPPNSTTLYSYSTDTSSKSDHLDQDGGVGGTLISGQTYAPLQRPPSRRGAVAEGSCEKEFHPIIQRGTVRTLGSRY